MSEDFESEWKRYCDSKGDGAVTMNIKDVAKHYAQWQREQMKKDAIEGWVARDECGDIAIFSNKPHRDLELGMWTPSRNAFLFPRKDEYPDVTWNSEPQKVKVIIIKD